MEVNECCVSGCIKAATHMLNLDHYCDEHYNDALDKLPDDEIEIVPDNGTEDNRMVCEREGCTRPATHTYLDSHYCKWCYVGHIRKARKKRDKPGTKIGVENVAVPAFRNGIFSLQILKKNEDGSLNHMLCADITPEMAKDIIAKAIGLEV